MSLKPAPGERDRLPLRPQSVLWRPLPQLWQHGQQLLHAGLEAVAVAVEQVAVEQVGLSLALVLRLLRWPE